MESGLIKCCFAYISVALILSHAAAAAQTPDEYWKSVLPNSPMPKSISDLLHPTGMKEEESTYVGVGKGGVSVNTGGAGKHTDVGVSKGGVSVHAPGTAVGVRKGGVSVHAPGTAVGVHKGGVSVHAPGTAVGVHKGGVSVHAPGTAVGVHKGSVSVHAPGTAVGVGKGGVSVHAPGTSVGVGKGGVGVHAPGKGKPVYVGVGQGASPFVYNYAASEDQLKDNPNVALFFLETDIRRGTKMTLHFTKSTSPATFLPRQAAEKIPFSSNKMPEVFSQFSVDPASEEAQKMKKTVGECEETPVEGEEKYCATSLESMIDFSTSKLGKKVRPVSTEVNSDTPMQKYAITKITKMGGDKAVVCHKQNYVYAVFYCHKTISTKSYMVTMAGADGTKAKAVAVCHTNTSAWNPKHLAFQVLKVKPGTVPICHFLPEDHVVWVPY